MGELKDSWPALNNGALLEYALGVLEQLEDESTKPEDWPRLEEVVDLLEALARRQSFQDIRNEYQ